MLTGIRVLDFSQYLPGPFATMRLADQGAEVVKVESLQGDLGRKLGELSEGVSLLYQANNRNKKSIAINVKKEQGKQLVIRLLKKFDVLLESFRPGVMERLGLGYEEVAKINPGLVYCSLSGYGPTGSISRMGSHDINYMALSGVLSQLKDDTGKLIFPSITMADLVGSLAACEKILAALVKRSITGKGTYLSIAMTEQMLSLMGNHAAIQGETGNTQGLSLLTGEVVCYTLYETKDGGSVTLAALESKFWRNFCLAVEREDWLSAHFSPTHDTNPTYVELKQFFQSRTWEEWLQFSLEVDCCLTPVFEPGEWNRHPYFQENQLVQKTSWGILEVANPSRDSTPPPRLGEHTKEVLMKELEVDEEQLRAWKQEGVLYYEHL